MTKIVHLSSEIIASLTSIESSSTLLPLFDQYKFYDKMKEEYLKNALLIEENGEKQTHQILKYMFFIMSNLVMEKGVYKEFFEEDLVTHCVNYASQTRDWSKLMELANFFHNFVLETSQRDRQVLGDCLQQLDIYACFLHIASVGLSLPNN